KGVKAGRCVMNGNRVETEEIEAYSALALAGLGWLPDTIMTRSIIIRMRRRHKGERVEPFRRRKAGPDGRQVYQMIETWARTVVDDIIWPELPPGIEDRDADVWEDIIAVADLVGGKWSGLAREAAVALVSEAKENIDNKSLGIRLLADLRTV